MSGQPLTIPNAKRFNQQPITLIGKVATEIHFEPEYAEFGLLVQDETFDPEIMRWTRGKASKFIVQAEGYLAERVYNHLVKHEYVVVLGHLEFPEDATTILRAVAIGKDLAHPRP